MCKIFKKLGVYLIVAVFVFNLVSPLCIVASDFNKGVKPTTEWSPSEWVKLCYYLGSKIGLVGESFTDAVTDWCNGNFTAEGLAEKFNDFKVGVSVKDGKVLVSSSAMDNFKGLMDTYIADCGDYVIYPSKKPSDKLFYIHQKLIRINLTLTFFFYR